MVIVKFGHSLFYTMTKIQIFHGHDQVILPLTMGQIPGYHSHGQCLTPTPNLNDEIDQVALFHSSPENDPGKAQTNLADPLLIPLDYSFKSNSGFILNKIMIQLNHDVGGQ